jgi:hypothetical protein
MPGQNLEPRSLYVAIRHGDPAPIFESASDRVPAYGRPPLWRAVEKIAVVGDAGWLEINIGIMGPLTPQQVRYLDRSTARSIADFCRQPGR